MAGWPSKTGHRGSKALITRARVRSLQVCRVHTHKAREEGKLPRPTDTDKGKEDEFGWEWERGRGHTSKLSIWGRASGRLSPKHENTEQLSVSQTYGRWGGLIFQVHTQAEGATDIAGA